MNNKIRFVWHKDEHGDSFAEIRAKRLATGKWDTFGFCHAATVALIRKDGLKPHLHLIRLPA